jgi:group I intron endonuclease
MHSVPNASGVYQILCVPTDKVYVGSAINLARRWREHVLLLRKSRHTNSYLQHAWNKYGEDQFHFSILELVEVSELIAAEQKWIDSTGCTRDDTGFNVHVLARSSLGVKRRPESRKKLSIIRAQTWEGFIDPEGHLRTITNLWSFCEEMSLSYRAMCRLAKGQARTKSYKGWTHRDHPKRALKVYEGFIDPDGNLMEPVVGLEQFCRKYGLNLSHMHQVYLGQRRSHKGWSHNNSNTTRDK